MTCVSYAHHFIPDNNLSPLRYKFYVGIVLILLFCCCEYWSFDCYSRWESSAFVIFKLSPAMQYMEAFSSYIRDAHAHFFLLIFVFTCCCCCCCCWFFVLCFFCFFFLVVVVVLLFFGVFCSVSLGFHWSLFFFFFAVTINCGKAECWGPVTQCEKLRSESQVLTP